MGNAANGATMNGTGASPAAVVVTPRAPVDVLEAWLATEIRKGKPERLDLVLRSDRHPEGRVVESWGPSDAGSGRELAEMILGRAAHEQAHGFETGAAYELLASPSKKYVSLDVPIGSRTALANQSGAEGAIALLLDQLRKDQEHKEKFLGAAINIATETTALNIKAFKDRDAQAGNLITSIAKAYESQVETLTKLVTKLMAERENWVDQYMRWSADNTANELAMQREASKAKMKEEVFASVLKPILPTLAKKFLVGVSAAMGGKEPGKDEKPIEPAPEKAPAKTVSEKQANAIFALFSKLEAEDYEAMAKALSDEKRLLFVAVAEAFMETT